MTSYFVQPYDVLFFRGNKSFDFGEWYTEGVFPPYPTTFQGFVRNKVLRDAGIDDNPKARGKDWQKLEAVVGNDEDIPFHIRGPFLMTDAGSHEIFIRTPFDLFREEEGADCFTTFCPSGKAEELASDAGFTVKTLPEMGAKLDRLTPPEFISLAGLCEYRMTTGSITIPDEQPFVREERVVIGLDEGAAIAGNRTVKETRFCVTAYNRFLDCAGFYFSIEPGPGGTRPLIEDGPLRLGGEARPVHVRSLADNDLLESTLGQQREELVQNIIKTGSFRLILLQPGVFSTGWLPFEMRLNGSMLEADGVEGLDLVLSFAFTGAPLRISGYSFAENMTDKHKKGKDGIVLRPMVRAVPAGAVYAFSIKGNAPESAVRAFVNRYDNRKIEEESKFSRMGFNHVVLASGR